MDDQLTITTEKTPNPNSLKYKVGRLLIPGGSANFPTAESAQHRSPFARRLFMAPGVTGVFIGSDFFTITRIEGLPWDSINRALEGLLEEFFQSGDPVLQGTAPADRPMLGDSDTSPELLAKITALLDEKVRPAVAQDGGDIIFRGFSKGTVYLEMHGACSNCPSSTATLKMGVETMLRQFLPDDVTTVEAV